ncbi:MAG TPA: hypothetical protein VGE74_26995 [Gemmata sp.]
MSLDLGGGKPPADEADGTAQFAQAIENMLAQDRLAAEAAERRKQAARELKQLYGDFAKSIEAATNRNRALMDSMRDGTWSRQAREMGRLTREYEKLRREAELTARYGGQVGGWLARHEKLLGGARAAAGYAGAAALATGGGLVRQGFSGTVEQNRLGVEVKMLSREFAGAFKPVIDVTTKGTRELRKFMESLTPAGQNVVAFSGVALAAAAALRFVGAGGLVRAGAGLLLSGGMSAAASVGASVAGSAAGTAVGTGVGTAAGGAAAGAARKATLAGTARYAVRASPVAVGAYLAADAASGGDYGRLRRAGKTKFEATFASLGISAHETYHKIAPWGEGSAPFDAERARLDRLHPSDESLRRQVSVAGGGFEEVGSGYDRLNSAVSMVEAERDSTVSNEEGVGLLAKAISDLTKATGDLRAVSERRDSPPLRRPGETT